MNQKFAQLLNECLELLKRGELTESKLRAAFESAGAPANERQNLLFLQTGGTDLNTQILGALMVWDGVSREWPADPKEWPYNSVMDAVRDGWRIISFPNLALMMDESRTYGLGCEFILEKWE